MQEIKPEAIREMTAHEIAVTAGGASYGYSTLATVGASEDGVGAQAIPQDRHLFNYSHFKNY